MFTHELTHVVSHWLVRHQPPWLAEGIANYFQMAELAPGATSVQVGLPRRDFLEYFRANLPVAAAEMFGCHEESCRDHAFYATSWAMFSFLINEHLDQLGHYLQRLNAPHVDFDAAWQETFPALTPTVVDRDLHRWLLSGELKLPRIAVTVRSVPATARPLTDADVLAARSLLRLFSHPESPEMKAELDAALAADRNHVLARLVQVQLTKKIAVEDARAVVAEHPGDWRAWWLLDLALRGKPEADEVHRKLCALAPGDADVCAE